MTTQISKAEIAFIKGLARQNLLRSLNFKMNRRRLDAVIGSKSAGPSSLAVSGGNYALGEASAGAATNRRRLKAAMGADDKPKLAEARS